MKCEQCGKEFEPNHRSPHQRFCSEKCRNAWGAAHRKKKATPPPDERVCVVCGKTFYSRHNNKKCCSPECSEENSRRQAKEYFYRQFSTKLESDEALQKCRYCGKEFIPSRLSQVYCDAKCYDADHRRLTKKTAHESQMSEYERQARECNLDYGTYRGLISLGKTYEELKAQASMRSPRVHQHTPQRLRGG